MPFASTVTACWTVFAVMPFVAARLAAVRAGLRWSDPFGIVGRALVLE
jgi:hypothetical protein